MASLLSTLSAPPHNLLPRARRRRRPCNAVICSSSAATFLSPFSPASPGTKLDPLPVAVGGDKQRRLPKQGTDHKGRSGGGGGSNSGNKERDEFYLNLGTAVRTLRDDLPALFTRDLNYDIYREDITFADPLNTFQGIDNYRRIFWALRFHGRILFKDIGLDVLRIWQLSDDVILIRWNLRGVPRVPWEASGQFQGTSRYKLDRRGNIYEHRIDNLAFNFPNMAPSALLLEDLVAASASPCPPAAVVPHNLGFLTAWRDPYRCSWVEFYRAVRQTLEQSDERSGAGIQDVLVTCS